MAKGAGPLRLGRRIAVGAHRRGATGHLPQRFGRAPAVRSYGAAHHAYNAGMGSGPLQITSRLAIPNDELVEKFVRAAGPGGQNVNKVASAVELRFDVAGSRALPEPLRERLLARRDRRLTDDGVLVIEAQRFRTQERNREDARERLVAFVAAGLSVPKPRVATKPSRAAKARRMDAKRERGEIKRGRSGRNWE